MKLIVTEKDSAAQKVAQILGDGVSVKQHGAGRQKVKSYWFDWDGEPAVAVGLRGHVMETVFPDTYRRWSLKYLDQMIESPDLEWVVDGGAASTLAALRAAAKGATEVIIATDYDREGELIGEEALRILSGEALRRHPHDKGTKPRRGKKKDAPPPEPAPDDGEVHLKAVLPQAIVDRHHRARYSALTPTEVKKAFGKLSTLDFKLAEAAHTRQDIDLIWGAVLTRFMSLASYRYGSDYLSIGRVQTPTLRLIVDRELERRAFIPEPYWEIKADLVAGDSGFTADHTGNRFLVEAVAAKALAGSQAGTAEITALDTQARKIAPPPPFNTTALMSAASGTGVSPARAMKAAESLYLDGLISYPRTDNTVYPQSLDLAAVVQALHGYAPVAAIVADLKGATLKPTRGKKRTTDHPPIYPVAVPHGELSGDQAKVYDLVARRFLATLLPAAVIESQRLDVRIGSEPFVARGSRVASPGFLRAWGKYTSDREKPLPAMAVGDVLDVSGIRSEAKETQPPNRYGQGPLIEKMEELGLGTKATRADIIQHLYDRHYVRNNPVEPTELGIAVIKAFDVAMNEVRLDISSPEMTAKLEAEMDLIAEKKSTREKVVADSQKMLAEAHKLLSAHLDEIRAEVKGAVKEDLTLGVCAKCGGELRVLRGKTTGKRFVACMGKEGDEPKVPEGAPPGTPARARLRPDVPAPAARCYHAGRDHLQRVWLARDQSALIERPRTSVAALSGSRMSHQGEVQEAHSLVTRRHGRGFLITFEGVDGCGKTTQAEALCSRLAEKGVPVGLATAPGAVVREPGGTPVGERLRDVLLHSRLEIDPTAEALLYAAARAQLVASVLRPALTDGRVLVLDRYIDSSLAYQGHARGLGIDAVYEANLWATGGLLPDVTFVLDVEPAAAAARPGGKPDRIEREGLELQQRVAEGYRVVADRFPDRVTTVDGDRDPGLIADEIEALAVARLGSPTGGPARV